MTREAFQDRLRFNRIDAATGEALRTIWPLIKPALPGILARFYVHVKNWPDIASLFANETAIARASQAQAGHWARLFTGTFDAEYEASARKIAVVHTRIGLPLEPYLGGYLMVLEELQALLLAARMQGLGAARRRAQLEAELRAVDRAVMFDIETVVGIYLAEGKAEYGRRLDQLAGQFDASINGFADRVAGSADALRQGADRLLNGAERGASGAAQAADGAAKSSDNMQAVAAATEEMTASIGEINRQVAHAADTAVQAVATVERTDKIVRSLNEAADRIGQVVTLIQSIASQTNLLALNATIEAARAGDAGKGFAVVAGEVKALSGQTARATDDIATQVSQIQSVARDVAAAMGDVARDVSRIREAATAISGAVEEQGAVTAEIGRSVADAAAGSSRVTGAVSDVRAVSQETTGAARNVADAAGELSKNAAELRTQATDFIEKIRAADRRGEPRERASATARLTIGAVALEGYLKDISGGGAACRLDASKLPAGDVARLEIGGVAADVKIVNRAVNLVNLRFADPAIGARVKTIVESAERRAA
ncbi:MAG: methyl-accepting chemotaxis protein [Proteobacteria bacterium]|nr:methyl-accepting chemotaxis protein [Pseudomonadota bacterium]